MPRASRRNRTSATNITDAILGIIIPIAFLGIAAFQLIETGSVDREVLGILLILALGALGWRIDVFFEKYLEYKTRQAGVELQNSRQDEKDSGMSAS